MGGGGWANPFAESNWEVISGLVRIPMDSRVCGRCSVSDERSDSCRTLPNNIEKLPTFSEHPREPGTGLGRRSEEHTSELQSRLHLVCRLLLGKNKNISTTLLSHPRPFVRSSRD